MGQVYSVMHWQTNIAVKVSVSNGRIVSVFQSHEEAELWIAPGLIDVQLNGIGGINLNASDLTVDQVQKLVKVLHQGGVTRFCPTLCHKFCPTNA